MTATLGIFLCMFVLISWANSQTPCSADVALPFDFENFRANLKFKHDMSMDYYKELENIASGWLRRDINKQTDLIDTARSVMLHKRADLFCESGERCYSIEIGPICMNRKSGDFRGYDGTSGNLESGDYILLDGRKGNLYTSGSSGPIDPTEPTQAAFISTTSTTIRGAADSEPTTAVDSPKAKKTGSQIIDNLAQPNKSEDAEATKTTSRPPGKNNSGARSATSAAAPLASTTSSLSSAAFESKTSSSLGRGPNSFATIAMDFLAGILLWRIMLFLV